MLSVSCLGDYCFFLMSWAHGASSPNKQSVMFIYSSFLFSVPPPPTPLPFTMLKLHDVVVCRCATETMLEIYWPRVLPFDTQDVANRSCAISHLLRLPCKADLSCLSAIFKPWAPETYGAMGNFIINALHLSDLIQACCRSCRSTLYIYTPPQQTRAPLTNPAINTWAGVTPGETFLWSVLQNSREMLYSFHLLCTSPTVTCEKNKERWLFYSMKVDQRVKHKGTWHLEESHSLKCHRFQTQTHSSAFTICHH